MSHPSSYKSSEGGCTHVTSEEASGSLPEASFQMFKMYVETTQGFSSHILNKMSALVTSVIDLVILTALPSASNW